jgi:hypothetical protein
MGQRAEDDGKSESRPVMGRIGAESFDNITPRESEQTSIRSSDTKLLEYRLGGKAI